MAFLFKLLAVDKALSIQAHPHKSLAEQLHKERPDIYKDDNHKPEIAIALTDDFKAAFGFLPPEGIARNLRENRVLAEVFKYEDGVTKVDAAFLKGCVHRMFFELDKDLEKLEIIINKLVSDVEVVGEKSEHQKMLLTLREQYGTKDVGLLFIFFLNLLTL
jgi:mannose-6-phosphate isomerase